MTGVIEGNQLASLSLLDGASPADLEAVAARMWCRQALPGEVLAREGEPGATFGLVLEGRVAVTREGFASVTRLDEVGPGSILGELAVLRDRPRTATLTAVGPVRLAVGDRETLELLLHIPPVLQRLRQLASARLARDLRPVPTFLKDGTSVLIRPLLPVDRRGFGAEIHRLSEDSLRRRFFTPQAPSQSMIDYLVDIDYVDHFAWLAVDADDHHKGLATARFVRGADHTSAEVAFGTSEGFHGRGLATLLLGALGVAAVEGGIDTFAAHVLEDNAAMRAVFAKAKAKAIFDEPGVLLMTMKTRTAAEILEPQLRAELASAVHDIVTAASLALSDPEGSG
ncbi:MAG TPA: cyclic nucleotide-binding domain-containing protein [Acidimicrobiales bacterium]|nr:cyclic nucleotide-binding domain-containing protein [Acidimicrobiales bacterium]